MIPEQKQQLVQFDWKRRPFEHQIDMANFHYEVRNSLDLSEVGTGKTLGLITVLDHLVKRKKLSKILVICPNSIIDNWAKELKAGSDLSFVILRGSKEKRVALLEQQHGTDVYLINYEGVRVVYPWLNAQNFDCVVCDEIHHIKSYRAEQTKLILALGKGAYCRKGLTGTILTKDLADIWAICQFINPDIFKTNFWGFRNRYMMDENAGKKWLNFPHWVPRPCADKEVREKIEPHAIRFAKRDVLKFLPPVLFERRAVDLLAEQAKAYSELKRRFVTELESGEVVAALQILPRVTKLLEITSGFIYNSGIEGQKPFEFKTNAKRAELIELLDEIGEQRVVIWVSFKQDCKSIKELLDLSYGGCGVIDGDTKQIHRQPIVDQFNRGELRYLVCNAATAGEGLNIYTPYAIYFSRNYKLGERVQSLGRHDRPGAEQFENITVIDLVAANTIDEEVLAALERKEDLLTSINPESFRRMLK
jgi:SNF2 family DNA or RNA helicase